MKIDGNRAYELLKKMNFIRTAGSPKELEAAHLLQEEIRGIGMDSVLESFQIPEAEIVQAELEVLEPYQKSYTVTAYKCSQNVTDLSAELVYADNANETSLKSVKGKIVLVNGYLRLPLYKRLIKAGAVGFITMSGTLLDKEEETDLFVRTLRENLQTFGLIPGVNIRISDAFEMVTQKASRVRMTVQTNPMTLTSQNVVAEIPGTLDPEEVIVFGAHYDSVPFSVGISDNGAGSVINMELLRYFKENPPARTVKFVWFGSEEIGLYGSKAYVKMHEKELPQHIFMINVDIGGLVLGFEMCNVTASKELTTFIDMFMKIRGYDVEVQQSIYSSDSIPFADKGIPAVNFLRSGTEGSAFIHSRYDNLDMVSAKALEGTACIVRDFSDTFINAVTFPEKREIPQEMVEAVDKYLYKKELEEEKKEKGEGSNPTGTIMVKE